MLFVIVLLILLTTYIVMNEKIEQSNRFGWCAVLGIIGVLYIIFEVLL